MESNSHIDRANSPFSDPPSSNIDRCSLLFTHPKRLLGPTRLQPRSAGFTYIREVDRGNQLGEALEARKSDQQICVELVKGPQPVTQYPKRPSEHRKRSIKTVFNSRSKRKSLKENSKMPVATLRTSDGRKYGQILSEQIYDSSGNASTYQVNIRRRSPTSTTSDIPQKQARGSSELVRHVSAAFHHVHGTKQPIRERSTHSSLGNREAKHRLSPNQAAGTLKNTSEVLGNKILTDRLSEGRNEGIPVSLASKINPEDSLGLLRDFSQILSRGETANLCAGASQFSVPEAEHQPRVRDFATNGSMPVLRARAAVQRRARSPAKIVGRQIEAPVTLDRSFDADISGDQLAIGPGRRARSIMPPPMAFRDPAGLPLEPPLHATQKQVPGTRPSPAISYHSKAPSVVSAESTAEDIQSDTSSGVVFNAKSAVFVKVPPQPGPAPLTPLPSLPEGLDSFPVTPQASQSSRNSSGPESSLSKVPPQKSPARSQYKLYPSMNSSSPVRSGSPVRTNPATEGVTRLSPPLHPKSGGCSFPRSDCLPMSMSHSILDEPEHWNKVRVDRSRRKKLRDLSRMRSQKTPIAEVEPTAQDTANAKIHEDVAALQYPGDSYNSETLRSRASHVHSLSASTTLQNRDSSTLSPKLSPIIVVAEQEPIPQRQRAPSSSSHFSMDKANEQTQYTRLDGSYCVPPHPTSPTLQGSDGKSARPVSSHSLPLPHPLASRLTTTPLFPPLRDSSCRSLPHLPTQEISDLEARLSAMERKNAMLERAFLAVLNTSAAFGGIPGLKGIECACGDISNGLPGKHSDQFGGTSGPESLCLRLENSVPVHSGRAGARLKPSSVP